MKRKVVSSADSLDDGTRTKVGCVNQEPFDAELPGRRRVAESVGIAARLSLPITLKRRSETISRVPNRPALIAGTVFDSRPIVQSPFPRAASSRWRAPRGGLCGLSVRLRPRWLRRYLTSNASYNNSPIRTHVQGSVENAGARGLAMSRRRDRFRADNCAPGPARGCGLDAYPTVAAK